MNSLGETFASAFEGRASCRAGDSALPWLYGIATNLLRRRFRAERRQLRAYARRGVDRGIVYEDEAEARADGSSWTSFVTSVAESRPRAATPKPALRLYWRARLPERTRRALIVGDSGTRSPTQAVGADALSCSPQARSSPSWHGFRVQHRA
jgi:RNA polymerase sigma-70 factor, ECF subfamily